MFSAKLYKALADDPGLVANMLHTKYVYETSTENQRKVLRQITRLLDDYSDEGFLKLGFNKESKEKIQAVIDLKKEPNWEKVIRKFLKGMKHLLEREIAHAKKVRKPKNIAQKVKKELKKIHIYERSDRIEITEKDDIVKVNYISLVHSPEHDGKFGIWRDTQLKFSLYFDKGLFVWDYINIHKKIRSRGIGTELAKFCERLAKDLGFRRFSVEWPNRSYWQKKMGYEIPQRYKIGCSSSRAYTHEGYKEI